ncbi:MAG: class I SAM-dependent RNA methyltransferase [Propionibacteriaceae bacterium]|nr:class I SAM-dependent RNA methyltransferase [Propionibacteriaceae bacterium]
MSRTHPSAPGTTVASHPGAPMIVQLETTDVAHGGYCVARHEGMVVLVSGAAPGEVVDAEITAQRAKLWYGRTVRVHQASADRVPHPWDLAERMGIGGADLGHVSLEAGRRWKARVIETQMLRLAHLPVEVEVEEVPGDQDRRGLGWRTRVTLQVCLGRVGMYAAKSHQIVEVDGMPLAHEDIHQAICADVARGVSGPDGPRLYVRSSESDLVVHTEADCATPVTVEEEVRTYDGRWTYRVGADCFWQVHRQAPAVLVEAVLAGVAGVPGPVADLYAGAGLFTQPLADLRGDPVTAVEASARSADFLRANTAGQDVVCLVGDVVDVLSTFCPGSGGVVVCDPPRRGAGSQAVQQMARLGPDRIVYVACDPAALARDVSLFDGFGYDLTSLRAFDLFPLTHHVESVAVLSKR